MSKLIRINDEIIKLLDEIPLKTYNERIAYLLGCNKLLSEQYNPPILDTIPKPKEYYGNSIKKELCKPVVNLSEQKIRKVISKPTVNKKSKPLVNKPKKNKELTDSKQVNSKQIVNKVPCKNFWTGNYCTKHNRDIAKCKAEYTTNK